MPVSRLGSGPSSKLKLTRVVGLAAVAIALASGVATLPLWKARVPSPKVRLFTATAEAQVLTGALPAAPSGPLLSRPAPASGPLHGPVSKPKVLRRTLAVGNVGRSYLLVVPDQPEPAHKYPLVLFFHGDGGDGAGMQRSVPFESASHDRALVAYPDGQGNTWDLETLENNKDIAFMEALITDVERDFTIDRSQVFATGYSNGGFFANVLACHRSSMIRAIGSNAGGAPYNQAERWPNGFPKCPGEAPVAAIALHGEQDMGVTLDSGRFSAEYWAYINGCTMTEMETTAYPECRAYRSCQRGKDVVFCQVPGLSHWVWDRAAQVEYEFFRREGMTP